MSTAFSLLTLIEKGSEHLATLCRLCEQEKQAIEQQSADKLQAVVDQKKEALTALAINTDERNQLLIDAGVTADQQGIEQYFSTLPSPQQQTLRTAWSKLAEQLQQTVQLNQRNEQIVSRTQKNLDHLAKILRGQNAKTTIYDQAGLKNYSARGTIGKA